MSQAKIEFKPISGAIDKLQMVNFNTVEFINIINGSGFILLNVSLKIGAQIMILWNTY